MTSDRDNRVKFSKQRVEALPAPASRVAYYYDTETRGLAVSVGKTGRKTFLLYRKVLGRPVRLLIGPFPDVTVEQARAQCARVNGEIASGKLPSRPRADLTFAEAFRDYMEKHSQPTKRTSGGDRALYERNLTGKRGWPSLAPRKLSEIDGSQLRAIHRAMHSTPIAANRTMALVSSVFTHAIREGYYEKLNPARTVRKYPERSRERFLRKDEMRFLLESLDADGDAAMVDFVSLAIFTGARRGNILSMRWEEVDLDVREWRISRTKNGDAQVVPLSGPAIQALGRRKERARPSEWVFPSNSTPGHLVEPKKGWKRILERATALRLREALLAAGALDGSVADMSLQECREFPAHALKRLQDTAKGSSVDTSRLTMLDLRMHDLRRTVGSWLASSGASLPLIGKVLNHKTQQATQVYARFMLDPVRQALDQVAADVGRTRV